MASKQTIILCLCKLNLKIRLIHKFWRHEYIIQQSKTIILKKFFFSLFVVGWGGGGGGGGGVWVRVRVRV
jgi:hypothetical protein